MDEEIIAAGIHQALKRGEPLNRAIQSFINAGYPREVVDKAVRLVNASQDSSLYTPLIPAARPGLPLRPQPFTSSPALPSSTPFQAQQRSPQSQGQAQGQEQKVRKRREGHFGLWLVVILIILATVAVNAFLVWKFLLGK